MRRVRSFLSMVALAVLLVGAAPTTCKPGDWLGVQREETGTDGRCHASVEYYQCGDDGTWVLKNREEYTVAGECRDRARVCQLYAGPGYSDICWEEPVK